MNLIHLAEKNTKTRKDFFRLLPLLSASMLLAPPLVLHCADTPAKPKEQKSAPEHRKYELPVEPDENVAYGPHRMQVIY
jgi:hypothetical protein